MKKERSGFTLLEMLTAIAVLALMMVFMFNIAGQSVRAWETGSRRMESAQSARIGMNLLASELRYAFAGIVTNYGTNSSATYTNYLPFLVTNNLPGESPDLSLAEGSQSLFFVSTCAPHDPKECTPFGEVGYMPVFVKIEKGRNTMAGFRYYLVRHGASPGVMTNANANYQDFYYRSTNSATDSGKSWRTNGWTANISTTGNRSPIVDNCIRFSLQFASNNNALKTIDWITNKWESPTTLPLGVLITMLVLDNKSATRLEKLQGATPLKETAINQATNTNPIAPADAVGRVLREGTTVIRRFVPLVNSYYSPAS